MHIFLQALPLLEKLPTNKTTERIAALFFELPETAQEVINPESIVLLRNLLSCMLSLRGHANTAHALLLLLAEYSPLNTESLNFEVIQPEDVVYSAAGYQYSLTELVVFHHTRPYRGGEGWNETPSSKWLVDPLTNEKFSAMDLAHILKKISITDLKEYSLDSLAQDWIDVDANYTLSAREESPATAESVLLLAESRTPNPDQASLDSARGSLDTMQAPVVDRSVSQHGFFKCFPCFRRCFGRDAPTPQSNRSSSALL